MCGIAGGCWISQSEPLGEAVLRRMTAALSHRGPDDDGHYLSASAPLSAAKGIGSSGVALGHRRLSIIDLSGGHQPLSNEDGSVWIAFNGEVYNYRELKPQLESLGHRFRTLRVAFLWFSQLVRAASACPESSGCRLWIGCHHARFA